jgi:hypothetical protein
MTKLFSFYTFHSVPDKAMFTTIFRFRPRNETFTYTVDSFSILLYVEGYSSTVLYAPFLCRTVLRLSSFWCGRIEHWQNVYILKEITLETEIALEM